MRYARRRDEEPADLDVIASQPAHGTIAGKTFTLGTRHMHISDGELWVNLLTDPVADCTGDRTDGSYPLVIFFTRTTPGRYLLSFENQTITLVDRGFGPCAIVPGVAARIARALDRRVDQPDGVPGAAPPGT